MMDKQRVWLRTGRKRWLRTLAVILSFCVLLTSGPHIWETVSVFAAEEADGEGRQYISGFAALPKEVGEQTVPLGTELRELSLPVELEAYVVVEDAENSGGGVEAPEDSEDGDDSADKETDDEDIVSDDGEDVGEGNEPDGGEEESGDESGKEESDGEENNGEESGGEETSGDKESDNEEAGNGKSGSDGTEQNEAENADRIESDEARLRQDTHTVTMPEYHGENVISAQTLENTKTESAEEEAETVTIDGVTWQSEPEYDGSAEGTYTFTAALPEGYTLSEGVSLPKITVTVEDGTEASEETASHAWELLKQLLDEYFAGEEEGLYEAVLRMDEDTRLAMMALYEEVVAAMTEEENGDEEWNAILSDIRAGFHEAGQRAKYAPTMYRVIGAELTESAPVRAFSGRMAAGTSKTAELTGGPIALKKLDGEGTGFYYTAFQETKQFTPGTVYAFLDDVYDYHDAVANLGSGAVLEITNEKNECTDYARRTEYNAMKFAHAAYVKVITRGEDFDTCKEGGIFKVGSNTGTPQEYRYFCGYGGAQNCGPLYAYTYEKGELSYIHVEASLNDITRLGSNVSDDYTVTLTLEGRTITMSPSSYSVYANRYSGKVEITVKDSEGNRITTNFQGPLAVLYLGNAAGVTGVPAMQGIWAGNTLTLRSERPVREGYRFDGWRAVISASSSLYQPGDSLRVESDSETLYAVWTDIQPPTVTTKPFQVMLKTSDADIRTEIEKRLTIQDNEPVEQCRTVMEGSNYAAVAGVKTITVKVTDKAGNVGTATVEVTVAAKPVEIAKPSFDANTMALTATLKEPGAETITETGFVWGIMTNPSLTLYNGKAKTSPAVTQPNGTIKATAGNLQKGVTYYARAYAIAGTGEGRIICYSEQIPIGLGLPAYGTFTIQNNGNNTFTVKRTGGSEGTQTVYFRTVNGSAVGGTHFEHQAGTLTFVAGETSKNVTVKENNANTAYSGKPTTAYTNADRTYQVELYRVEGGSALGDAARAERTMTAGADYKISRSIYTQEKSLVNVAETSTTTGKKIADTTSDQGGTAKKVHFLLNRDGTANYNASTAFSDYYSGNLGSYLQGTASGWYYRYQLYAYEHEDGWEHAYVGTDAVKNQHYDLANNKAAVNGIDGQLWACNFQQGEKDAAKYYYFPDTRTGGGENSGKPYSSNGTTYSYHDKTYVSLGLAQNCYVYFSSTGDDKDIWYIDGLTSYAQVYDDTEPQLVKVAPMAGGVYKKGDSFTVALVFDEIVDKANSGRLGEVTVNTNWGLAKYVGGADTNVLYFTGTVGSSASGQLTVQSIGNPDHIKDMCTAETKKATATGTGSTGASVDTSVPAFTVTSKGIANGVGTAVVSVTADKAKTTAMKYAWTDSVSMPTSGWINMTAEELSAARETSGFSSSIRKEAGSGSSGGKWYLHVMGTYGTTGETTYKSALVDFGTKDKPAAGSITEQPSLTVSVDNSQWAKQRVISLTPKGAAALQYRNAGVPGSKWQSLTANATSVTVKENGYYTFLLTAGDVTITKSVTVEKIDNEAPTASIGTPVESGTEESPKQGVYTKITLPVTYADEHSGVKTVQYAWTSSATTPGASLWQTLGSSNSAGGSANLEYTATETSPVAKYLHVKVTDALGHTCTAHSAVWQMISKSAVEDHTPGVTLTGVPVKWTNDMVTLIWKLTNGNGRNYEVTLPNGKTSKAAQGQIWVGSNGTYTVKVRDLDYGGENTAAVTVQYIDTTAPTVTVSPSVAPTAWNTAQSVTFTASDSQSGVGKKYYKIVTSDQDTPAEGLTELTSSSVSVRENGVWYVYYKIYDQAGDDTVGREANKTEGFVGPIKIDVKTPTLTATAPDKGVSKMAGLEVTLKAVYGASGGTVKVGNSTISALGATADDIGGNNDITKNATYKINAKGTYRFVLTGGSGKTASKSLTVYEAAFDPQGGTGTTPVQLVVNNGLLTKPTAPTKTGHTFKGWYTAAAGGEEWNFAADKVTSDRILYARWEADAYTVTFHKDGGTIENESGFTRYTYGTGLTLPAPTKAGYTFGGWYKDSAFSGGAVTKITETDTGDKEYHAKWTPNTYTVTYDGNGSTGGSTSDSSHTYGTEKALASNGYTRSYTVTFNHNHAGSQNTSRTASYIFAGWNTLSDGSGTSYDNDQSVTNLTTELNGIVTLYARWTPASVTYTPTRTGYAFAGWYTNENCSDSRVDNSGVYFPTADITLYAKWTAESYNVMLNGNGGSGGTSLTSYTYGTGAVMPTDWGKTGYTFAGWYENEDCTGTAMTEISATDTGNKEYWAKWTDDIAPVIGTLAYSYQPKNIWQWLIGKDSLIITVPVTEEGSGADEITYTVTLEGAAAATETEPIKNGEAKITVSADFRGTISIVCTDKAGNTSVGVTVGADLDADGIIIEDNAPDITTDARTDYYDTATAVNVTVKDDTGNAITAGLAAISYQVGDSEAKSVIVDQSTQQSAAQSVFTIPAAEIPTGITQITITASDNAGNEAEKKITVKVKGPEKKPAAKIDYRGEKLTGLVPGEKYSIGGTIDRTEYTADGEGRIPIDESWFGTTVNIVKKGNGNETTDSPAQDLSIPARPAAPGAPELSARTENSITLKTITDAQYRLAQDGQDWQDSASFEELKPGTVYSFTAYYPATDTSFASAESSQERIATVPTAPTPDKLKIGYVAETLVFTDGIEAFSDANCTTPVTASSAKDYMGQTVYIRYPAKGIIPASLATAVPIPARPAKPAPGTEEASYPTATDGAITGLTPGTTYEYRVKDANGDFGAWKAATPSGTKIENLPAGEYEVRVKAVETGNASFRSEAAAVTIGAKPATKYETPDTRIDHSAETLTGFVPGAKYTIGSDTITAGADGTLPIKKEWFGTTLSITRNGNDKDKLDSDTQSLPVPARPAKPTPTGADVSTAGGTGKLTGLTAGTTYEVSTDGGKTWETRAANESGEITGLASGAYVVRVKAGTDNFASELSDSVKIGAYQIKVTFMVDGAKYKEIPVDHGAALADIPPVPEKENVVGAWYMDEQGTTPAVFTNITADMTVYAVYTTAYTVTLQTGTGYTLSAEAGSESPVREGGSFTFRFTLEKDYRKTADFAVKVNGVKVDLTADDTYTIANITEDKTVTVEGVSKKTATKPGGNGGGDNGGGNSGDKKPGSGTKPGDSRKPGHSTNPSDGTEPSGGTNPGGGTDTGDEKKPGDGAETGEGKKPGDGTNPGGGTDPADSTNPGGGTDPEDGRPPIGDDVSVISVTIQDGVIVIGTTVTGGGDGNGSGDHGDGGSNGNSGCIYTGTTDGMTTARTVLQMYGEGGNSTGAVIVTVVCEEQECTAGVADTMAVANAVLTPEQIQSVQKGRTIEIRIDVTDISEDVPTQDKEVIESGIWAYREEVPGLTLGMYVDISMFIKVGGGDWNAVTETDEPIEVVVGIPEDLLSDGREFYIIRAHNGEYTFMSDMDDAPDTITVSTDLFSSYSIAYVEADETGADSGAKCGLCHICPTFLGICCFIWLAVIIALVLIIYIIWRKKRQKEEKRKK